MGEVGILPPLVETRGYKMLDVIGSQCFMIFVRDEILSEKSVLSFPNVFKRVYAITL